MFLYNIQNISDPSCIFSGVGSRVKTPTPNLTPLSGSELRGKPVSEVLEWLFPLFDDLTQLLCKRDDVATVF